MREEQSSPTKLAREVLSPLQVAHVELAELVGEGTTSRVLALRGEADLVVKCAKEGFDEVLLQESRALSFAAGPGVPRLYGVGRDPTSGRVRLVMERLLGKSLEDHLRQNDLGPAQRLELCQRVFRGGSSALMALHAAGWSHGDVKPANLCGRGTDMETFALVDFGLASSTGILKGGTPRYLPPEVLEGAEIGPDEADTYGLLLTLAEIFDPFFDITSPNAWETIPLPWRMVLEAGTRRAGGARPRLSLLVQEALDRGLVQNPEGSWGTLRREYVAIRASELVGNRRSTDGRAPLSGLPAAWMGNLTRLLQAIDQVAEPASRSSDEIVPLSTDLSVHDRSRLLVRLLGPHASSFRLAVESDEALIEALGSLAEAGDLRAITQSDLSARLAQREARPGIWTVSDSLDDQVRLSAILTRRPVPRGLLLAVADSRVAAPSLRIEAARAARQMGEYALALRLLELQSSDEARLEKALVLLRVQERSEAFALLSTLLEHDDPATFSHAKALLARRALDEGRTAAALELTENVPESAALCEVRALALLALERVEEASDCLDQGEILARTDEAAARLSGVRGMVAHARGDTPLALSSFARAVDQARQAGAALEEAVYATGLAAAASTAGHLETALDFSERAELLFEALDQEGPMARSLLAKASVLSAVGASAELELVVRRGLSLARKARDTRCEAYLWLCLCDGSPDHEKRLESAAHAVELLEGAGAEDRLRAAARQLVVTGHAPEQAEDWEKEAVSDETLLDWWKARAQVLERSPLLAGRPEVVPALVAPVIEKLKISSGPEVTSSAKGPALVQGALLALRAGMADDARELLKRAEEAATFFSSHVPKQHRVSARNLPWIDQARGSRLQRGDGGAQLSDVETLLRALGRRDGFRGLLKQVLDLLLLWTEVQRGMLLLRAGDKLVVRAARNLDKSDLTEGQKRLSFTMAERALAEGRAVVAVDAASDLSSIHRSVQALNLRSVLAVPLIARGEILGVAYLDDKVRKGAFGERELAWANLISTVAALAIADERDRLQLERALRRAKRAESRLADRLHSREVELELAQRELSRATGEGSLRGDYSRIIHRSSKMRDLLQLVDRIAKSDVPALVFGESGTGKELIARAIAESGPRKDRPFVAENCGAVPEGLMESVLFGHQRGAFTGATQNQDGLFALADGGTLFLDEIGEMSLALQTKLLRVLQEGRVKPLGASRERPVDVRLLAATHQDLKQLVEEGRFRQDLYYRLHVVQLTVPPLRERPEDIPLLVDHFLAIHGKEPRSLSQAALARLCSFPWPGNVRQLENEVRRMLVLGGRELTAADLSPEVLAGSEDVATATTLREKVDALERRLLLEALEKTKGNRTRAAEILGLSRYGLQKMSQRLGIGSKRRSQRSGRIPDRGLDDSR